MLNTKQILELVSDSMSIPWDDEFSLCKDSFQKISFKEGDEIALFADIETFENQELPFLIYNPAYNEKYSIFYIFFSVIFLQVSITPLCYLQTIVLEP